jgi:hypothetical protein
LGTHICLNWGWSWIEKCEISTQVVEYFLDAVAGIVVQKIS